MSVRAVWIVSQAGRHRAKILFSRAYPTVETRAKAVDKRDYVAIPERSDLITALFTELEIPLDKAAKSEPKSCCNKVDQKPVFQLETFSGKLWPVIVIEQFGLLFCCLPLVEQGTRNRPSMIEIPGISIGFSLLLSMADFLGQPPPDVDDTWMKFAELYLFLSQAAPFGRPVDLQPASIRAALLGKPSSCVPKERQPAWKPVLHKGKSQLYFTIAEKIKAVQYDRPGVQDVWRVYGTVTCKADLEGMVPEVTINLSHQPDSASHVPLDHLIVHPCVTSADTAQIPHSDELGRGTRPGLRKLRFTPPLELLPLCHYTASTLTELPIQGFYQMKGESTAEILVQLKLSGKVKNQMEYCELQMPFFNRGIIRSHDSTASFGSVLVSPDKRILVWNIGARFPSKSLEVQLKSTVYFSELSPEQAALVTARDDPFCVGQNAYAQIFFKIPDFTHTGCYIDPKSIQISNNVKYKLVNVREYSTVEYKIWNSHGDAPIAYSPP